MCSKQSNSRPKDHWQTTMMLGQKARPAPIAEQQLPFGCSLEILTAVLLFKVFGEISSYFLMARRPVYSLAIKAFTAD